MNFRLDRTFLGQILLLGIVFSLTGCGGQTGPKTASISGVVTDLNGNPARGARVFTRDASTTSTNTGAYFLSGIRQGTELVQAELTQGSTVFRGQNVTLTFRDEQTQSLNIVIAPESQLATIRGRVTDRSGARLEGVSVLAFGAGTNSSRAVTNRQGDYTLNGLIAGINYTVTWSARGYTSDTETVRLTAGESRVLNASITPGNASQPPAPRNLSATVWTVPQTTRDAQEESAYENIKRIFDPNRPTSALTRAASGTCFIEVDLSWDPVVSRSLLGYGIYRGTSPSSQLSGVDFLREPLAGYYAEVNANPIPNPSYYEVTALSTSYPDLSGSESSPSNRVVVRPLAELLTVNASGRTPLVFSWSVVPGATGYVVFLFDRFPGIGVSSIWSNSASPATGSSVVYNGPALQSGREYFFLVLGLSNDRTSRTISKIGSFAF